MRVTRRGVQLLGAVLGWGSLLLLYATIFSDESGQKLAASTVHFFSYFTVLSNILVAAAFSFPVRMGNPALRGAIALYIAVTGLIYFLLLRHVWEPSGIQQFTAITMHYVLPPLYLLDWIWGPHRAQLRWRHVVYWLVFPLLFALYTLVHGAFSGFYPYYFLDAGRFGYPSVLTNMGALTGVFLLLGLLFVAVDRKQPRLAMGRKSH